MSQKQKIFWFHNIILNRNVMQMNTSLRYGCCHDGVTIAQGPNKEGCPDSWPNWSPAVSVPFAVIKLIWNDPEQCSTSYVPAQFLPVPFCFHLASVLRSRLATEKEQTRRIRQARGAVKQSRSDEQRDFIGS